MWKSETYLLADSSLRSSDLSSPLLNSPAGAYVIQHTHIDGKSSVEDVVYFITVVN